jgi:hypothetical protein
MHAKHQGLIAVIIGIVSFFIVPPGVSQTQTWLCPKGYLTKHDEKIIVNRVIRDDPNKASPFIYMIDTILTRRARCTTVKVFR